MSRGNRNQDHRDRGLPDELLGHASQQPALYAAAAVARHDDQIAIVHRIGNGHEGRAVRYLGARVHTFAFQPLADVGEQRRGTSVELGEGLLVNGRVERHDRSDFGWDDAHHVDHGDEVDRYT